MKNFVEFNLNKKKDMDKVNENDKFSEENISDIMKKSLEYYEYIDIMGEKLSGIISKKN